MPLISPENIRWRLKQVHGGRIFEVNMTDNYMVGRSQTAQISLNSNKTSRTHSSFVVNVEGHLLVQDLKSVNGTFVNGTQIAVYVSRRVFPGDIIGFGLSDLNLSENDRDRQTFFVVLHEELRNQAVPPVEANLADSTTDLRENSTDSHHSCGRNSTANIASCSRRSHLDFELPSTSNVKQESIDIIEITSSTGDEKPDLEILEDCFEEDENVAEPRIENVCSVPEKSPERKKLNSNNWLQKLPSPKRLSRTRSANLQAMKSGGHIKKSTPSKQVISLFGTSGCENKEHNIHNRNGSSSTHNSCSKTNSDLNKADKDSKKDAENNCVKKKRSTSQKKEICSNDNPQNRNLDADQVEKGLNAKQKSLEGKSTKDNVNSNVKSDLLANKEKTKEPATILVRKSSTAVNTEKDNQHPNTKSKDCSRRKSIAEECTSSQKDVTKTERHPIAESNVSRPARISSRRNTLGVPSHDLEGSDDGKRNIVAKRRKSIAEDPSYTQKDSISEKTSPNQKQDKLSEAKRIKDNIDIIKKSKNNKEYDTSMASSRRTSVNNTGTGKKDEGERSLKSSSRRGSLPGDLSNQTGDSTTKHSKETIDNSVKKRSNEKSVCNRRNKESDTKNVKQVEESSAKERDSRRESIGYGNSEEIDTNKSKQAEESLPKGKPNRRKSVCNSKNEEFDSNNSKQAKQSCATEKSSARKSVSNAKNEDIDIRKAKQAGKSLSKEGSIEGKSVGSNKDKEIDTRNGQQSEGSSAKERSSTRKSVEKEKNEVLSRKKSLTKGLSPPGSSNLGKKGYKESNMQDLLKSPIQIEKEKSFNLILQLEQAISGDNSLLPGTENNDKREQKTEQAQSNGNKNCSRKKKEPDEEIELKAPLSHKHKKVKIDDCDELILNDCISPIRRESKENSGIMGDSNKPENTGNSSGMQHSISTECPIKKGNQNIDCIKEHQNGQKERGKNKLYIKVVQCPSYNTNSNSIRKNLNLANVKSTDKDPTTDENDSVMIGSRNIKYLEKSFTTDKDNSVVIDITDDNDDDEMDFSASQIFHMSQIVKSEAQDDTFQKIKNELAEMDFCEEETIINHVPINLDSDMSGFENTQDICACLEDDEENKDKDNLISNEENEELLNFLAESDKSPSYEENKFDAEGVEVSSDESLILAKNNQESLKKPECMRPPVIKPQTIVKPEQGLPKKKDTNVDKEGSKSNKRKNSLETSFNKKKLKCSPRSVVEPPRCDSKSIQEQFKKRHSGSKVDQFSKLRKDNIREERRKKLKEIAERNTPPKATESKCDKGKTVKVLPESKTRRGNFLCEGIKKISENVMKFKINKNSSALSKSLVNESTNDQKTTVKGEYFKSGCNCREPRSSSHQIECPVHTTKLISKNSNEGKPKTSFDTNDKPSSRILRSATPNKDLLNYKLKPLDLPEPVSRYNLRRTKSSGDIKADLMKLDNQLRPAQTRYNLRHSTALDTGRTIKKQDPRPVSVLAQINNEELRTNRYAVPPNLVNSRAQYIQPPHNHQMNTGPYGAVSRSTSDLSSKLMWSNGGPSNNRRPPVRRLPGVDEVVQKMVHWLPNWLTEQVNIDYSAPVNSPPATAIPVNFKNYEEYYNTFSKLVLLENWQYLFKGFREGAEHTRKVKIEHVRIANDLLTLDCVCYITQKELRQGHFYKPEDFVLLECVVNDKTNTYMSLNFGFISRCKKSIISNNDILSIRREPHTKLEFTIITRYQAGKEINTKKFPLVKLLANIRAHLMLIRAIKMLADSPLCLKILHPKINEYKFSVTQKKVMQSNLLNAQQRSIVLEAASLCTAKDNGIYCIKGPPGTGKSTVIVNLVVQILFSYYVENTIQEPPMILLAAPSNTAVDNLLSKLTTYKHNLPPELVKHKGHIKCVRIGPEASISKELIGYSLPKLAEQHIPIKHHDVPVIKAAKERNENIPEVAKTFFGDRYTYEIKACEDIIIEKSNIICTTLNSCINGKLIEAVNRGLIKFTCCIIDEATQCHEVEALLPTILGINKCVLVGDPKQLNATIMNRDAFKLGFGDSLFSRIANNFSSDPRTPIRMLNDQYRMHEEICHFPNKQFYEGKLRSLSNPPNKLPEQIRPYLVFNCEKTRDSGDYTNIDEVNLIKKLLTTIFGMIDRNYKYTVGIITPYNAQKDLINSSVVEFAMKNINCKITVNTVDSFQGSENDIVIISCVRDSTNSFLQNEHRLNVALTRAKQALYIIGNYTLFKECRTLYDLREDAKKRKLLLDIRQDPMTIDNFSKYLIDKTKLKQSSKE